MQDLYAAQVDQCVSELLSASEGVSLKPLFQRLDSVADKILSASDADYACTMLQQAALRTTSTSKKVDLLRHALYRAQVYAGFATSGGEGLARMREVERVRLLLNIDTALSP